MILITNKQCAPRLPITATAVLWLLLDRLHPPGWVVGVAWTLLALVYLGVILVVVQTPVGTVRADCFENVRE